MNREQLVSSDRTTGRVVWLTGLPASGKTTLARRVAAALRAQSIPVCVLDSDEVRSALCPDRGYDAAARDAFYEALAQLAALLARQRLSVVVAATAHLRRWRDRARALCPAFFEVYLDTTAELCAQRDEKGLYRDARAGGAPTLPGAGVDYEPPLSPEVVARGGKDDAALDAILSRLVQISTVQTGTDPRPPRPAPR